MIRFPTIGSLDLLTTACPVGAAAVLGVSALGLTVAWGWPLAAVGDENELVWSIATVVCIVGGSAALGWLRSARVAITAPQIMLLLGAAGMVGGLSHDAQEGGLAALASLCLTGPGDFLDTLSLHWQQLPAMHVGMIAGGLTTVPLLRAFRRSCRRQFCARVVQNLTCSAWMVVGMAAGTVFFMHLADWTGRRSPAAMLGGMFAGMVWGMVVSVTIYRLWFWVNGPRNR